MHNKELRDYSFVVTFNVAETFSDVEARKLLGYYTNEDLTDAEWEEAAREWMDDKLKEVSELFDISFECEDIEVEEY